MGPPGCCGCDQYRGYARLEHARRCRSQGDACDQQRAAAIRSRCGCAGRRTSSASIRTRSCASIRSRTRRDFEPNYFPGIEFDRPDFPWLFTPAKAGADAKLRPWLCLVVVRAAGRCDPEQRGRRAAPVLNIDGPANPADELPDLVDSWAWVHAQVAASNLAAHRPEWLKNDMRTRPERSLSRLLCPANAAAEY